MIVLSPNSTHEQKGGLWYLTKEKIKTDIKLTEYRDPHATTNWNETYIKLERQFTDPDSVFHLSVEELFVFAIISIDQRKDNSLFTCFHMIEENMPIRFRVNGDLNRKLLMESLQGLRKKRIISLHGTFDYKDPYKPFYIRINYDLFEGYGKPWRGFNEISLQIIKQVKRMEHLYIYNVIKGYDNSDFGGFVCSYTNWTEILQRSPSSVKRYIKEMTIIEGREMCDKSVNLIYTNYGDYIGGSRTRQQVNTYRTIEFCEDEKTSQTKKKDAEVKKSNENSKRKAGFGDSENPF